MKPFERCGGSGSLTRLCVILEVVKGRFPGARTGYEFRFVRLEGSDEMPVYVFRKLKARANSG